MFVDRAYWTAFLARHVIGQARYPFRSRATILRDQARNVRRMMAHAYKSVPYYQEAMGRLELTPADFRTAADLAKLPPLERRELQADPERFLARGTRLGKCLALSTSGSTGAPLTVYLDRRTALLAAAHAERYRAVLIAALGGRRRYRESLIVPLESSHQKHTRFWMSSTVFMERLVPRKQILSLFDPPEKNIPRLAVFRPDIIHSYGSYVEALFARLADWRGDFPVPRAVGFSADGLSDAARRLIQDRFGIPCFSAYGAVEATRIGFECDRHSGLHINEDIYPVRLIDGQGRSVPDGESGEAVVSNLVNRAMVILNYRLGDIASFLPRSCPCGRTLPLLSFPQGRENEWLRLPDGRNVNGLYLHILLRGEPDVFQYRIIQLEPSRFELDLVHRPGADRAAFEARVKGKFRELLGSETRVEVKFVLAIPASAEGKARPIVSLVEKVPDSTPEDPSRAS
jgi:phenylacetate-CoA ligase